MCVMFPVEEPGLFSGGMAFFVHSCREGEGGELDSVVGDESANPLI